jgi:hypothetical protein
MVIKVRVPDMRRASRRMVWASTPIALEEGPIVPALGDQRVGDAEKHRRVRVGARRDPLGLQ